jgi:tetratricopeptide (TPR) repeat protein
MAEWIVEMNTIMNTITDKQFKERIAAVILLRQQGYYEQARSVAMDLVQIRSSESAIFHQLGQIWTSIGEWQAALECFAQALYLLRAHVTAETHGAPFQATALGYAQSLMRLGRFEEAWWPYYEVGRLNVSWQPVDPTAKLWEGENSASLLVQVEGGYGDIFMNLRFLPTLKRYAPKVGVTIFPNLADAFDWKSLGVDHVYRVGVDKIRFGEWDYVTSFLSLPGACGVQTWSDIPPVTPPAVSVHGLKPPRRIGFCWRAEENASPIKTKSLPVEVAAAVIERLGDYDYYELYSLSPEKKDLYNTGAFLQPDGLEYEASRMATWKDTIEYVRSMDFVITVDTAVAHLAGILGVPTLCLLPKSSCWRWGVDTSCSAWYGPEFTLYRQPTVLEWNAEEIIAACRRRAGGVD